MSTLGEWLDAMVRLRQQKAQVAEYNASQQAAGFESLAQGIVGLGKGLMGPQQTQEDVIANRMMNRATPPRAVPTDPSVAAAAPTLRPGEIPYSQIPITAQPFTGGKAAFDMAHVLNTEGIAQSRADAYTQHLADLNENAANKAAAAEAKLAELIRHHKELEEAKDQGQKDRLAMQAMGQASKSYQEDVKTAHGHNTAMTAALSQAAGAKTQADWEKAVTVITGHYMAGVKAGFKDLPYPQIPPSPDQKAAAKEAMPTDIAPRSLWSPSTWWNPSAEDLSVQKQTAEQMPGAYQYPGPAEYELAPEPTPPSTRVQDYYSGGPGSPQTTPQSAPAGQPSQQGAGAGGAAPEGTTVTNAQGVKMKKVGGKWVVVQ